MKTLRKKRRLINEGTVQAYRACTCGCACSCGTNPSALAAIYAMGEAQASGSSYTNWGK